MILVFEKITEKPIIQNLKLILSIKYDFKLYKVSYKNKDNLNTDALYIIEKDTPMFEFTNIEIFINPFINLDRFFFYLSLDFAIEEYLKITDKIEIDIMTSHDIICKAIEKNGFVKNSKRIYNNVYSYNKHEEDMII